MHFMMKMMFAATFQIFVLLAPAFGAYVFPDDFQLCQRGDKNLNECLLSAIRDALPKLASPGISSPITIKTEPVLSPYCEYHPNNEVFIFDEYFYNLSHTGFNNSIVENASINAADWALNFTTFSPYVVQSARYVGNGTILYNGTRDPEPFWGAGPVVKELFNTTILHQIKSKTVIKDGEAYLEVESYNVTVSLDLITFDYQNLYNGTDPEMAKRAGGYVNATAPYITECQKPYVQEFLAGMFKAYAKAIIGSVPLGKLIPGLGF